MPERLAGGRRLAWREGGAGAPALLLHCALAHSGAWAGVMARLGDRLAMRAPDLPGHGRTDPAPEGESVQEQALADARALLPPADPDGPAPRRVHLIGHSFGGTVALRLAVAAPERVASLTLVDPVLFALLAETDPGAYAAEMAEAGPARARMAAGDWEGAAEAFLARWGTGAPPSPAQRAAMVAGMPFVWRSEAEIAIPETATLDAARLRRIAVPTLVVTGAASPASIGAIAEGLAQVIPNLRRVEIPGAGHMVPITHAAEVSAAIRDFLFPD